MIDVSKFQFHDTQILRVVEDPRNDELTMDVNYPVNPDKNQFERRKLVFRHFYNYQIKEIPFDGCPTIVDAMVLGEDGERTKIRLETNAGCRELYCKYIDLIT